MLFKKGIVRKTFLFSALLILLVVLISFSVMYVVMPSYYLTQKEKNLQGNLDALTQHLRTAAAEENCAALISDFSETNNVNVLSFDGDDMLLPALSTPFLGMRGDDAAFFSEKRGIASDGQATFTIRIQSEKILENKAEEGLSVKWAAADRQNAISIISEVNTDLVDHLIVSGTLQPIDEARSVILSLIPYVLAIAIAVGLVLSGVYARQISKPILQISDAALRMQQMDPDAVSHIRTKDELGQLSANLDVLYAKLLENIGDLKEEMEKANRLERSKTEMMQGASHELKTPIAALNGMIEGMIDNVGAYRDKEKYLLECKSQVDKLSYLVGEILSASRADLPENDPELSETPVDELLERAISENMYQIHEKNLRLQRAFSPASLLTDPGIFYHAISNLVSNAVRYTPPNGEIRISITGEGAERRLIIENECEPIPPEELPKLFEPFYTRSYSRDKTKSGTGLGLYITKRSLERLAIPFESRGTERGFQIDLMI